MSKDKKICTACNGSGHDKASRPVVKFKTVKIDGKVRKKHITVSQGSGCFNCGGLGTKT